MYEKQKLLSSSRLMGEEVRTSDTRGSTLLSPRHVDIKEDSSDEHLFAIVTYQPIPVRKVASG